MTGKDILLRSLNNQSTERPAWVPFIGVHGGYLTDQKADAYLQSAQSITDGLLASYKRYQPDGLPVAFDLQIEAEILGCELKWSEQTPPSVVSHPLSMLGGQMLSDLPPFDINQGRLPLVYEALRNVKQEIGEQVGLYGLITGPFTLALHLMGNDIFLEMFDREDYVSEVISFCADVAIATAGGYLDNGADVIGVVDPMTSQISAEHFEQFVTPHVNRVFDFVRQRGGLSSMFVCGDATRNLEAMCRTTTDNISIDENISLQTMAELAGQYDKSFGGNLKLTTVLLMGDQQASRLDTVRCLDAAATRQGFVLAPGCDLPYAVPPVNLEAVAEMVHDPYKRELARSVSQCQVEDTFDDVTLPDYEDDGQVYVDLITLDSQSCAPCQYMLGATLKARQTLDVPVVVTEHKITTRQGIGMMSKLGVENLPTICIDGEVSFISLIPDTDTLAEAILKKAALKRM